MGAFSDLLDEAKRLGAIEIKFALEMDSYGKREPTHGEWRVHVVLDPPLPNLSHGRTGEEALREMVRFLEALSKGPH